jgi:hypothetical protein
MESAEPGDSDSAYGDQSGDWSGSASLESLVSKARLENGRTYHGFKVRRLFEEAAACRRLLNRN